LFVHIVKKDVHPAAVSEVGISKYYKLKEEDKVK